MLREIYINDKKITYNLLIKNVKNINLRINSNGEISVSAGYGIDENIIKEFILSKSDFIIKSLEKIKNAPESKLYFTEEELKCFIVICCKSIFPYYEKRGVELPKIRFRKMISQWGNCRPKQKILTFSLNLKYAPKECIEYVVYHEFTHFLQANHSDEFYRELEVVCPDWKTLRKKLKSIKIS